RRPPGAAGEPGGHRRDHPAATREGGAAHAPGSHRGGRGARRRGAGPGARAEHRRAGRRDHPRQLGRRGSREARSAAAAGRPQHRPGVHRPGHRDLHRLRGALPTRRGRLPPRGRGHRADRGGGRRPHPHYTRLPGGRRGMTLLMGALLAAGLLLCASPWLWPQREREARVPQRGRLRRLLEEAGLARATTRALVITMTTASLAAASAAWLITGLPVLAVLAALAAGMAPVLYLRGRRLRLRKARRQLWPDVCDLLVAATRVGLSLPDAVAGLADSAPPAVRPAFAVFARDLHATGRFETSLDRLKTMLADPIADRIAETLRMARQVGGTELTGVLRALSASVRADAALRGEVEA